MEPRTVSEIRRLFAAATGDELEELIERYSADPRAGIDDAISRARARLERERAERARLERLCALERQLARAGARVLAGVDEVGRGALAGPVTAAAVILPDGFMPARLTDSKRLDPATRERLDAEIRANAIACAVAHVSAAEVDALGIAQATAEAMRQAVSALGCPIDHVLVDGHHVELGHPTTAVVKGDASVRSIAAASIVAKVARDALMVELATAYDGYGLATNKGYGSPDHLEAIRTRGPSEIHRRSFAPCSQTSLF